MKFLAVFFLAFAFTKAVHLNEVPTKFTHSVVTRGINEKLIELIESFREILRNGNATLGLPVMDPLEINNQKMSMDSALFKGDIAVDKMKLTELSEYEITSAKLAIVGLKLTLGMRWSELRGKGLYDFKGVALNFIDTYGAGNLKFVVEDLAFSTTVAISSKPENKTLFIKEMTTSVSLGDLQVNIDGIFDNNDLSDVISAIVSDLVPGIVEKYQKKLTDTINTVVMTEANKVLSTMTLKDLLAIVQGK